MTDPENFHKEIIEAKPVAFDIIKEVPVYCKIRIYNELKPCKIRFKYRPESEGKMHVFASCRHKEPTEATAEYV